MLHCTLSIWSSCYSKYLKQLLLLCNVVLYSKYFKAIVAIMQCSIVLQVFKAIVVKVFYCFILPYTLWHAGITVNSCYYGIMPCCVVL